MKICMLTSVHNPLDIRIFHKEAKTLVKHGYDVCLIAPADSDTIVDNIYIHAIQKEGNRLLRYRYQNDIFRKIKEVDADVYHFHDIELIYLGLKIKKKLKRKVIYDSHEDYPLAIRSSRPYIPKILRPVISIVIDYAERYFSKKFDSIVAVYEHRLKKITKITQNSILLPNYPSHQNFMHINLNKKDFKKLLYLGLLSESRGAFVLLKIMERLKNYDSDIILHIIGDFGDNKSLQDQFLEEIETKKLSNIIYHGRIPYSDVPKYIQTSSIGLIPWLPTPQHLKAANPTKLFEYMASSIVTIAGDYGIFNRIFSGKLGGILYPDITDDSKVCSGILNLINNENILVDHMRNAKKMFDENYNWEILEPNFLNFYQRI